MSSGQWCASKNWASVQGIHVQGKELATVDKLCEAVFMKIFCILGQYLATAC